MNGREKEELEPMGVPALYNQSVCSSSTTLPISVSMQMDRPAISLGAAASPRLTQT